MKRKSILLPIGVLSLLVMLVSLIHPSSTISAQSEDGDPDFIVTLALMALADDRMDGVMDASALSDMRVVLDEYYEQKRLYHMDEETSAALSHQKQVIMGALDQKIDFDKSYDYRVKMGLFAGTIDAFARQDIDDPYSIFRAALFSSYHPDPEIIAMLQQRLANDTQTALQDNLNGNLAETVENGDALIDTKYDFNAGQSADESAAEAAYGPLMFVNTGERDVHLVIEYYEPPVGMSISAPSLDTILPGGSSITQDGFPAGSYVFCVDWETSMDTDGDGIKDYDQAVFHSWISNLHSAGDLEANAVHVGASFSPTPTGRCDGFKGEAPQTETLMTELFKTEDDPEEAAVEPTVESTDAADSADWVDPTEESDSSPGADFWDQDDDSSGGDGDYSGPNQPDAPSDTGLTAAELANEGEHAYEMTCTNEGLSDTRSFTTTWEFTEDGAILGGDNFYAWIGTDTYQNDYPTTITFTTSGYLTDSFYTETSSEGVTTTSATNCIATIQ